MNYLAPGLRELTRKYARQLTRLRIAAERRRLARAETELGLLGWQQADFDAKTQREVDQIQNYEREQARLTNESAELGQTIRAAQEKKAEARRAYEDARRQLDAARRTLGEPLAPIEKQLIAMRRQEPQYEKRIPDLDREMREVNKRYTELLAVDPPTPRVREELGRLRERVVAIPNEKADLRTQHMRVASEIKSMETRLAEDLVAIAGLEQRLAELDASFTASDRELATELKNQERERARIGKEIDGLEGAKANPYQQIGRVLADSGLAPMNQPHVLEKVFRHRLGLEHLEAEIEASAALSAQNDRTLVRISYLIWSAMVIALLLIVGAIVNSA